MNHIKTCSKSLGIEKQEMHEHDIALHGETDHQNVQAAICAHKPTTMIVIPHLVFCHHSSQGGLLNTNGWTPAFTAKTRLLLLACCKCCCHQSPCC